MDNTAVVVPDSSRAAEKANPIVRLLPSLTDVIVILTILFLFGCMHGTHTMLGDGDTGWHIRTGQWILAHGQVPHQDIFSYTMPGKPWYAWEWLWDVLFAVIYNHAGLGGVILGSMGILCLTMALLFRLVRSHCANLLVAFAVTAVAALGSSIHWLARPHLITLLFGVIFYSLLERAKPALESGSAAGLARARRILWVLPVVSVLWTNLHGGFLLGIMLTGCYGAGDLARALAESGAERRAALGRAGRYLAATLGCALASLVNPYFIGLHRHIYEYLGDSYTFEHIIEFQTISFHSLMGPAWEIMIVLSAAAAFRLLLRKQFVYFFLCLGWIHLGLIAGRNLPLLLIVSAPLAAGMLGEMLSGLADAPVASWLRRAAVKIDSFAAEVDENDRIGRVHLVSVLALGVVAAVMFAPAPPEKFRPEYDPNRYPAAALAFLGGSGIPNRIFTDDEWGDYLVYTLYPTRVFVDGRSDFYGKQFGEKYLDVLAVKYDWRETLAKYSVDTILLPITAPLAGALKESHDWRVIYDDGISIVFRPALAGAAPGEQLSVVQPDDGTGRDRKITKSHQRDLTITKTIT